jgi:hypothetical protein
MPIEIIPMMFVKLPHRSITLMLAIVSGCQLLMPLAQAKTPPMIDIPEEVLRAEIITEARSPIDGKPLSEIAFAELVVQVAQKIEREDAIVAIDNNPQIKNLVLLVRLRGFLQSIGIPLK